jgi:hypothetical protein
MPGCAPATFRSVAACRAVSSPKPTTKETRLPAVAPPTPQWLTNFSLPWQRVSRRWPSSPSFPMVLSQVVAIHVELQHANGQRVWHAGSGIIAGGYILTCKHVAMSEQRNCKRTGRLQFTFASEFTPPKGTPSEAIVKLRRWCPWLRFRDAVRKKTPSASPPSVATRGPSATPLFFDCSHADALNARLQSLRLWHHPLRELLSLNPETLRLHVDDVHLLKVGDVGLAHAKKLLGCVPPRLRIARSVQNRETLFALGYSVPSFLNHFLLFSSRIRRRSCSIGKLWKSVTPTTKKPVPFIEHFARTQSGMSGGPLLNDACELVGVHQMTRGVTIQVAYPLVHNHHAIRILQECGMVDTNRE